ncbi:N-6 DNA methylase [Patescibacteria group bacterium]|nr:N-6 DNA methylase [Patescibacteria group bacterium]
MKDYLTTPLESASRKEVDRILDNLGWKTSEFKKDCNVFTERPRTKEEQEKIKAKYPKGRFPDYVLYKSDTYEPIAIIETKRLGHNLASALKQATEYAECLNAPIVFAVDGALIESQWVPSQKHLRFDGQLVTELLGEKGLLKFINAGKHEVFSTKKNTKTKEELINIFDSTNKLLREEGMREGLERFTEFSNLLFLKLIDEIETEREEVGEERRIEKRYCWSAFADKSGQEILDYINSIVLPKLVGKYNHSGEVFADKLGITRPRILKKIVSQLSELTLLDIDSDIKGDAFEYFLKNSVTVGNDLGEYYTPRHVVKLMVDLINPRFGDKVYDPTCGTGGFLIEAFRHIRRNTKLTAANRKVLENETIHGGELTGTAKIAKMNMILAGDGHTHIIQQDSLENPRKNEFDIVLSNFPFSQSTDYAHLYGFANRQGNPVFLKHIVDSLKKGGKAAVVVPDGVLFSKDRDSVAIRKILVETCKIEAVIQTDIYTFAPYTKQPTSIIIFEKGKKTESIWFFDLLNDGFGKTNKRKPIEENDLPLLRTLWSGRETSERSFVIPYEKLDRETYKLFLNYYKAFKPVKFPKELGELCDDFVIGGTPDKKNYDFYGGNHIWATIADMKAREVGDSSLKLSNEGAEKLGDRRKVKPGSLLMSFKLTLGKTAFAGKELFTNEAISSLVLKKEFDTKEIKEYLYHVLPVIDYTPYAQRAAKGLTLNKELIPTVVVPFPKASDREKIVKKKEKFIKEKQDLELALKKNTELYQEFIEREIR